MCRDGRQAGIGVSFNPDSDKLLIYLEGGGACFNDACDLLAFDIPFIPPPDGIFNRNNEDNPVADWNMVYVPYCTGDVHAGNATDVLVAGEERQFVGYKNIGLILDRLVPTFKDASQVVLTGISAGGFGAAANFEQVQRAFGPIPVTLVDDSGPPMPSEVLAPCLQQTWRETWGLENTILADCGADCPDPNDYVFDLARHVMRTFPDRTGGLFSNDGDAVISLFYGFGSNDCGIIPIPIPEADFRQGLLDFRALAMDQGDNFGTYYVDGIGHTCLRGLCFYTMEVDGVPLTGWVADLIDGTASHVGP